MRYLRPIFDATLLACEVSARMTARAAGLAASPLVLPEHEASSKGRLLVRAGERRKGLEYIQTWLETSASDYLKICDPYFGLDDLELLVVVLAVNPHLRVRILTSLKHQKKENVAQPYEESFRHHWRARLSDQEPPDTEVVIAGVRGDDSLPIHDRWWLTAGGGLRIGTSYRSLGDGKDSEISLLDAREAKTNEADVDRFLNRVEREHRSERLQYVLFTL